MDTPPNRCDCGCWNTYTGYAYPAISRPSANMLTNKNGLCPYSREEWLELYGGDAEHLAHDLARAREMVAA